MTNYFSYWNEVTNRMKWVLIEVIQKEDHNKKNRLKIKGFYILLTDRLVLERGIQNNSFVSLSFHNRFEYKWRFVEFPIHRVLGHLYITRVNDTKGKYDTRTDETSNRFTNYLFWKMI